MNAEVIALSAVHLSPAFYSSRFSFVAFVFVRCFLKLMNLTIALFDNCLIFVKLNLVFTSDARTDTSTAQAYIRMLISP